MSILLTILGMAFMAIMLLLAMLILITAIVFMNKAVNWIWKKPTAPSNQEVDVTIYTQNTPQEFDTIHRN